MGRLHQERICNVSGGVQLVHLHFFQFMLQVSTKKMPPFEQNQVFKLLTVAQPSADGQSYLPGTHKEIDQIHLYAKKNIPFWNWIPWKEIWQ